MAFVGILNYMPYLFNLKMHADFIFILKRFSNKMIPEIVALCIAIPSYALFLLQLNIIRKSPKLQSTFFMLFVLRGFFNIGYAVVSLLLGKLPSFGLFLDVYQLLPKFVLNAYFLLYYIYYAELLANMFMLLHRWTAFAFTVKYNQIWKKANPAVLALIFIGPIPLCTQMFTSNAFINVNVVQENGLNKTASFSIDFIRQADEESIYTQILRQAIMIGIMFITIGLLLNTLILLAYKRSKEQLSAAITASNSPNNSKMEKKITLYAVSMFFGHIIVIGMQIIVYELQKAMLYQTARYIGYSMESVYTLNTCTFPGLLILWASCEMRRKMADTCRPLLACWPGNGNGIVHISNQMQQPHNNQQMFLNNMHSRSQNMH